MPSGAAIANVQLIGAVDNSAPRAPTQTPAVQENTTDPKAKPTSPPFRLSSSLPVLPAKLVKKIQALQFVELKEFLPDNIKLQKKLEAFDKP